MNEELRQIQMLIDCGQKGSIPIEYHEELEKLGHMNRMPPRFWEMVCYSLELQTQSVIDLLKGMVLAEAQFTGWSGGSAAAGIWLYRILQNRLRDDQDQLDNIADWVLQHSDNPWEPFGTHNAGSPRSLKEYYLYEEAFQEWKHDIFLKEEMRKHYGVIKRKRQALIHQASLKEQAIRSETRNQFLGEFMELDPTLRLYFIARDDKFPPSYYPEECFELEYLDSELLNTNVLIQLYEKIKNDRGKKWRELRLLLEKRIATRMKYKSRSGWTGDRF